MQTEGPCWVLVERGAGKQCGATREGVMWCPVSALAPCGVGLVWEQPCFLWLVIRHSSDPAKWATS